MQKHSLSIWFFIGSMMAIYGLIILLVGIYDYFVPPAVTLVLANLHPAIWWGAIMLVLGGIYVIKFRPRPGDDTRVIPDEP